MRIITRMCQDGMELPVPDRRQFGVFDWRPLPFALTALNHNYDREVVGNISQIAKDADGVVWGLGDTASTVEGQKYERLIRDEHVTTVSVDAGGFEYVEVLVDPSSGEEIVVGEDESQTWDDLFEWMDAHPDYVWVARFTEYTVGELALTTISGWPDARIWDADAEGAPEFPQGEAAIQASAAPAVREFPAAWFERQDLDGPTPARISRDGQISGHYVTWDTCHRAFTENGECVTVPRDITLADFHGGSTAFDDGTVARTGVLTFADLHADTGQPTRAEVRRAMENTGDQLGPVRAYKDEYGIQLCGGVWGDVSPDAAGRAMAGTPSIDARERDGQPMALFGFHSVNTGGLPILDQDTANGEGGLVLVASAAPTGPGCGCGSATVECSCDTQPSEAMTQVVKSRLRLADMRAANARAHTRT